MKTMTACSTIGFATLALYSTAAAAETVIAPAAAFETPSMPAKPPATWLTYHLAHPGPGGAPGDPNCAFYWKGRYHLHYIYAHKEGCGFAHVSSTDMVHWKWHPTTLTPKMVGHGMFSGTGFITKEGRPAIIYHGRDRAGISWPLPWMTTWKSGPGPLRSSRRTQTGKAAPIQRMGPRLLLERRHVLRNLRRAERPPDANRPI